MFRIEKLIDSLKRRCDYFKGYTRSFCHAIHFWRPQCVVKLKCYRCVPSLEKYIELWRAHHSSFCSVCLSSCEASFDLNLNLVNSIGTKMTLLSMARGLILTVCCLWLSNSQAWLVISGRTSRCSWSLAPPLHSLQENLTNQLVFLWLLSFWYA